MKSQYFAALDSKEAVAGIFDKIETYYLTLESCGLMDKYRDSYAYYHGASYNSVGESHKISFGGVEGELAQININHYGNIAQHMIVGITSSRPAVEAKSVNTDYRSLAQTYLATGLLEYYLREKDFEQYIKQAVEYAVVFGAGAIKLRWNALLGRVINEKEYREYQESKERGYDVDIVIPEYEGDIEYDVLPPMDIVFDLSKEGLRHDWYACRTFKNRYDLIAMYPELEEAIMAVETKRDTFIGFYSGRSDESDDIEVWEFYHRRSEALPNGRYIFCASEDAIFFDGDIPYRNIPIYGIAPRRILGTGIGYTPMFDFMSCQEAADMLYSTILSNEVAFGIQTILNPQGSNINVSQIGEGLTIMDYNPSAGKPEPLRLLETPKEIFESLRMFVQAGETITGISSVVRGNPEASLRSGTSLALIQSNAIQFLSGLQSSYIKLIENSSLGLIEILQDFADSPRIATIVGESGKGYMREFKSDDIRDIKRITVDVGNPLAQTISGRVSMADNLLQYQLLKNPEDYINIINTGNIRAVTEDVVKESFAIRQENEFLMNNKGVITSILDNHSKHINSHKSLLADPIVRQDANLTKMVLNHINEHLDYWKNADPALLFATQQQPLPQMPPQGAPGMPGQPPQGQPTQGAIQGATLAEGMESVDQLPPQEQIESLQQDIRMPEGMEGMPLTPADNMAAIGMGG